MRCCCYLLATSYLSRFCRRVSVQSQLNLDQNRLKGAICLGDSFPYHHVALPARNIRKDRVNRTLKRFDSLPAPKHMVLPSHDTLQHSPTTTRPSYNLGRKTTQQPQFYV